MSSFSFSLEDKIVTELANKLLWSQNCDKIAKSFCDEGRTALQLRRMSGDHIKSDDGRCRKENPKLNLYFINTFIIHSNISSF